MKLIQLFALCSSCIGAPLLAIESQFHTSCSSQVESLTSDEKAVYENLSPIYQSIFLCALNEEERKRVVIYANRGLDPFEAIDVILRSEQRKFKRAHRDKSLTPAERSINPNRNKDLL